MHFVLYKAWVLKNGGLGPAVSVKFISMQLWRFSGHGISSTLMTQVDGCLECKVCILCCTKHGSSGMVV